ncbi:MAG: response regulator [Deltaproteobacteria bacterium]|nr:response regulator [Deltaproteobacteria bacterium]
MGYDTSSVNVGDIRLLLVDDEEEFRKTTANRMLRRGFRPEQARDGQECLAALEKTAVDVVVMDVKMPGMSGIEILGLIRKRYPRTEVILLTGHATTQDGVEGIKLGAFDYLTKPVELEHLLGKIIQAYEKILREEEKKRDAEFKARIEQQMVACERLASLGTLAAGVAHEINNPLAIIKEAAGWMKVLLGKDELAGMARKEDLERALSKIEASVERVRRITHQLLGFVRKEESAVLEIDLPVLMEEAVGLVGREAAHKDIEITQGVEPGVGRIVSDPFQIRQVLLNLLTNAVHATGRGGTVAVSIENREEAVAVMVRDTGAGIPRENLERIFEPFFSTKPPGQGTGLGLFVSRGIAERLGGSLHVESRLGEGSVFRLLLPRRGEVVENLEGDERLQLLDKIRDITRPIVQ